jgi:hypothetical protein
MNVLSAAGGAVRAAERGTSRGRVIDGPSGDDGVVPGGGHDVEDVRLLQLEPPALAEAVGGVRRNPSERDLLQV